MMRTLVLTFVLLINYSTLNSYSPETMKQTDKSILLGKYRPERHSDFVKAEYPYTLKEGMYLHKDTYEAFKHMYDSAKTDGITLVIISATRTFQRQKEIWENKWNGNTPVGGKNLRQTVPDEVQRSEIILKYSSMPGTSRHHWGTDIDINSVSPSYFRTQKGIREYNWLKENAASFGFCQPYKLKGSERLTGYEDEPWHWSYTPLSCRMLKDYLQTVNYQDIQGFLGSETAVQLDVLKNYVNGIHADCQCK